MLRAVVVALALVLVGSACGEQARVDRPIPGAPRTPRWLRERIWRTAAGLGDPHPTRIVVKLRLRERGRLVDRVWMRGNFVCGSCSGLSQKVPHGHLAGFTVVDATRQSLSFSFGHG